MLRASDVLADMYLTPIDRVLNRQGYEFRRYADDFRVNVRGWAAALALMDDIAERVRSLGLTLAGLKTQILTNSEVEHRDKRLARLLHRYASKWQALLTDEVWVGEYDEGEAVVIEPNREETVQHALLELADQWLAIHKQRLEVEDQDEQERNPLSGLLTTILRRMREAEDSLPEEFLSEVPFADPVQLQAVCEYLIEGPTETDGCWTVLTDLIGQGRQSPWARVWLAHTVSSLATQGDGDVPEDVVSWLAEIVLVDRHELVRVEAAYALAVLDEGPRGDWQQLVDRASFLTQPGLAAAAGRAGVGRTVSKSFTGQSALPLLTKAFEWGQTNAG